MRAKHKEIGDSVHLLAGDEQPACPQPAACFQAVRAFSSVASARPPPDRFGRLIPSDAVTRDVGSAPRRGARRPPRDIARTARKHTLVTRGNRWKQPNFAMFAGDRAPAPALPSAGP
jgi:hypothetical protein